MPASTSAERNQPEKQNTSPGSAAMLWLTAHHCRVESAPVSTRQCAPGPRSTPDPRLDFAPSLSFAPTVTDQPAGLPPFVIEGSVNQDVLQFAGYGGEGMAINRRITATAGPLRSERRVVIGCLT
ncbi:MAG: hypothetical protein IPM94_12680 [bacterium]|nr:hypothetical protein [bacterium]